MVEGITIGIISDILFLIITMIIAWFGYLVLRRRRLLQFFGVKEQKEISIYLSNLEVIKNGTVTTDGKPGPYNGTAVVFGEALQALSFQNLFNYLIPGLDQQPGFLKHLLVADINIFIHVSPRKQEEIDMNSTLITFGSSLYNTASKWIEETLSPPMSIDTKNWKFQIDDFTESSNLRHAVVQRLYDSKHKRMVFYLAGLHESGTIGAINYLVAEWRRLYKTYGSSSQFAILLEIDRNNYKAYNTILEKRL